MNRSKDLRREQIAILRLENVITNEAKAKASGKAINRAGLTAAVTGAVSAAVVAADKLNAPDLMQYAEITMSQLDKSGDALLIGLAEAVSAGHAAFEAKANALGFMLVDAGRPKIEPAGMVASILGIG